MTTASPYPLLCAPILLEKVWGGRRLERLGKVLPNADAMYGESWELADLRATSASGAGGGAVVSRIVNGPLGSAGQPGKTIAEAMELWGNALVRRFHRGLLGMQPVETIADGNAGRVRHGGFPLLVKFLDARENLSVQVHPSPSYAAAHADAHLKTECWYILDAQPQDGKPAVIYKGLKPGVSADAFERTARANDASIVDMLQAVNAVPGECHDLPSGTVHALGAGVMVAEVQTPSDTTFRIYDWGRTGRVLHIDEAMQCIDFGGAGAAGGTESSSIPPPVASFESRQREGQVSGDADGKWGRANLVTSPFYRVDELRVSAGAGAGLSLNASAKSDTNGEINTGTQTSDLEECSVLVILEGGGVLGSRTEHFEPCRCSAGQTWLVPAAVMHEAMIEATSDLRALVAMLV